MANLASNRSPSPLSARISRNSETNTSTRRSFNGNPFARPNPPAVNPRNVNPPTPANTPATTDHMKRGSVLRKSTGSSMFQDGKENHKDINRSPARSYEKSFMAPTISAASKFTPSPRKKVLSEKNEVARTSIQFLEKEFSLKPEALPLDQPAKTDEDSDESVTLEQKEVVLETPPVRKVTFAPINDTTDVTVTEDFDFVKIRPFCCSPQVSPIIAPLDADPLPPYDPKNNFLSPRPQFLRYKPNPRIELYKVDGGEDDVIGLEDSFSLSDTSSDTEKEVKVKEEDEEAKEKVEEEEEKEKEEEEAKLEDVGYQPSDNTSEIISKEKQSDFQLKTASKPRFYTRSKTILFLSVMFLVACFSVSFTDSPPMDLPIYKDVSFSEIYGESLKLASSAKESFDGFVENLKKLSNNLVSYLSHQISNFSSPQGSIQFFNLTPVSIQEEWRIMADYVDDEKSEEIQDFEEEGEETNSELMEEEAYEEIEVDVENEVLVDDLSEIQPDVQIHSHDDFLEESLNLEDGSSKMASISASKSEMAMNDLEIESSVADTSVESETLISSLAKLINPMLLAGFSMVIVAIAAGFYTIKRKSSGATATARVTERDADNHNELQEESSCSSQTSVQKGYKKKSNSKRDSLASSSEFSMSSASYGSFTTFEKIPIKKRDEVMLTPIRRSSRLVKSQV